MVDGTVEHEVESINKHKVRKYGRGSRLEYSVHWKEYASHDTWEPLPNLTNSMDLVQEYNALFQLQQSPMLTNIHMVHIISIEPMN